MVQRMGRHAGEPCVKLRHEDSEEETSRVLYASPPIPAKHKKIDRIAPAPLNEGLIGVKKRDGTRNIHTAVGDDIFLFTVDVVRQHSETGNVHPNPDIEPYLFERLRRIGIGLIGAHEIRTEPSRKKKYRSSRAAGIGVQSKLR